MSDFSIPVPHNDNPFGSTQADLSTQDQRYDDFQQQHPELVFVDPDEWDTIRKMALAANPENPEDELYRWGTAYQMGRLLGLQPEQAMANLDSLTEWYIGKNQTPKSNYEAVRDAWQLGVVSDQYNSLYYDRGAMEKELEELRARLASAKLSDPEERDTVSARIQSLELQIAENDQELAPRLAYMQKMQDAYPRSAFVDLLKATAVSAPFTLKNLAVAAIVGAGTAGLGAPASASAFLARAASMVVSQKAVGGASYQALVESGVKPALAFTLAAGLDAPIQNAIEQGLGETGGYLSRMVGGGAIAAKVAKLFAMAGTWGKIGEAATRYGMGLVGEGSENALQSLSTEGMKFIAEVFQSEGISTNDAKTMAAEAWDQFVAGVKGAVIMGVPGFFIDSVQSAKAHQALAQAALTMDRRQDFIDMAVSSPLFERFAEEDRDGIARKVWDAQQDRREALRKASLAAEADVSGQPASQAPAQPELAKQASGLVDPANAYRNDDGRLYTELRTLSTNEQRGPTETGTTTADVSPSVEIRTRALLKFGNPQTGELYGYIAHTVENDTVHIDAVDFDRPSPTEADQGLETDEEASSYDIPESMKPLFADAVRELSAKYPGLKIEWNTDTPLAADLKATLEKQSPTGRLDFFHPDEPAAEQMTWIRFRDQVRDKVNDPEIEENLEAFRTVVASIAKANGETEDALVGKLFGSEAVTEEATPTLAKGVATEEGQQQSDATQGSQNVQQDAGIVFRDRKGQSRSPFELSREDLGQVKALIKVTKGTDFAALTHEFFHAVERLYLREDQVKAFETALRKKRAEWNRKDLEYLADQFEHYLHTGEAPSAELVPVFKRIAEALARYVREFLGLERRYGDRYAMTEELKAAYDSLLKESPVLNETQKRVGVEARSAAAAARIEHARTKAETRTPEEALHHYTGTLAKYSDEEVANLQRAKDLDRDGQDPEAIRLATGWFKGQYDHKWRMETDDRFAFRKPWGSKWDTLGKLIIYPELFRRYPQLEDMLVQLDEARPQGPSGEYIAGHPGLPGYADREPEIHVYADSREEAKKTLSHEIQHAIQAIEGFAAGSSPEVFSDRDVTAREIVSLQQGINEILNANSEYGSRRRAANRQLSELERKYGMTTEGVRSVKWDQVPDSEKDAYFAKLDELEAFPEDSQYFFLQSRQEQLQKERVIESAYDQYFRTAGEIEARDVAARYGHRFELLRRNFDSARVLALDAKDIVQQFDHSSREWAGSPEQARILAISYELVKLGYDERLTAQDWRALRDGKLEELTPAPYSRDRISVADAIVLHHARQLEEVELLGEKGTGENDPKPRHAVESLEGVYHLVSEARDAFTAYVDALAAQYGGRIEARQELKNKARAQQKIEQDGDSPASVLDIDGKTLIFDDLGKIAPLMRDLLGREEVERVKNRFARPTGAGYRDFLVNLRMPNGAVVELQVTTEHMYSSKMEYGHALYEVERELTKAIDDGTVKEEANAVRDDFIAIQQQLYGAAWDKSQRRAASDRAVSLEILEAFMSSDPISRLGTYVRVLSEETRKHFQELLEKANGTSSRSKNSSSGSSIDGIETGNLALSGMGLSSTESINHAPGMRNTTSKPGDTATPDEALHHTREELSREAATFGSWEEFRDYMKALFADTEDLGKVEGMSAQEEDAYWKGLYTESTDQKQAAQAAMDDQDAGYEESDQAFLEELRAPGGLEAFLKEIYDTEAGLKDIQRWGAQDEEEQAQADRLVDLSGRIRQEVHPLIQNAATSVGRHERGLTASTRKSILTIVEHGVLDYKALRAELTDDQVLREEASARLDTRAKDYGRLADPRAERWGELSIADRVRLSRAFEDQETRKKIEAGEIGGEEIQSLLSGLEEEQARLKEEKARLEKEVAADNAQFSLQERKFVELSATIKSQEKELQSLNKEAASSAEKASTLKEKIDSLREALASAKQEAKLMRKYVRSAERMKAAEDRRAAVDKAKDHIRQIEARKRAARELREAKIKAADRIMAKPSLKTVNYEQAEQILAIQSMIDPRFRNPRAWKIEWRGKKYDVDQFAHVLEESPDAAKVLGPKWYARLEKKGLEELSLVELEDLANQVEELASQGRVLLAARKEADDIRNGRNRKIIRETVDASGKFKNTGIYGSKEFQKAIEGSVNTKLGELAIMDRRRFARDILDNGKDGINTSLLVDKERECNRRELEQIERRTGEVTKYLEEHKLSIEKLAAEEVTIDTGDMLAKGTFTKEDLLYMRLALRDEDSRNALIFGNFFNPDTKLKQASASPRILEEFGKRYEKTILAAIESNLSAEEKGLADLIGRDFSDNFARLNEAVIKLDNRAMKQVRNYCPIRRQGVTFDRLDQEVLEEFRNRMGMKTNPEKGFTVERMDISAMGQTPVKTNLFGIYFDAVKKQEHLTAYGDYIRELNATYKGVRARPVRYYLAVAHGKEALGYIDRLISEYANPPNLQTYESVDRMVRMLRGPLGLGYLGLKLSSVVKQALTSWEGFIPYAGAHMPATAFQCMTHPIRFLEDVEQRSTLLRNRSPSSFIEALKTADAKGFEKFFNKFGRVGMMGIEYADRFCCAIGWKAVYDKAKAAGMEETEALKKADDVLFLSQPSSRSADLAPLFKEHGEAWKLLTQFMAPMNVIYQQWRYDLPNAVKNGNYLQAIGIGVSYAIAGVLLGAVANKPTGDDDKDRNRFIVSTFSQFTDSVPLIGSYVTDIASAAVTGKRAPSFRSDPLPAVSRALSGVAELTSAAIQGEEERLEVGMWHTLEGIGLGLGAPVSAIKDVVRIQDDGLGALFGRR